MPFEEKNVRTMNFAKQLELSAGEKFEIKRNNTVIVDKTVPTGKTVKLLIQVQGAIEDEPESTPK